MAELEIHHESEEKHDPMGQKIGIMAAVLAVPARGSHHRLAPHPHPGDHLPLGGQRQVAAVSIDAREEV